MSLVVVYLLAAFGLVIGVTALVGMIGFMMIMFEWLASFFERK